MLILQNMCPFIMLLKNNRYADIESFIYEHGCLAGIRSLQVDVFLDCYLTFLYTLVYCLVNTRSCRSVTGVDSRYTRV